MDKQTREKILSKVNITKQHHKEYIRRRFFSPTMFDSNNYKIQCEIIDTFYDSLKRKIEAIK